MSYKIIKENGYDIHLFKNKKFKTITITVKFLTNLTKDNITMRSLLPYILKASSKNYPKKRDLYFKLEELYDTSLSASSRKYGAGSLIQFSISFINDLFIPTKKSIAEECINILSEIIFEPNLVNNQFDKKVVLEEVRLLTEEIMASFENKNNIATLHFLETMFKDDIISIPNYGFISELENLDYDKLYTEYQKMISYDMVDVIISGDFNDSIVDIIKTKFTFKKRNNMFNPVYIPPKTNDVKRLIEEDDFISQAKLFLGYRVDIDAYSSLNQALVVFSTILGKMPSSKLFLNVREKHQLAYNVYSSFNGFFGFGYIHAGISSKNFDKALSIISEQINSMANGDITAAELSNAKKALINTLRESEDSPYNGGDYAYSIKILHRPSNIEQLIEQYENVTIEEVIRVAKMVYLDTIYMLKEKEVNNE